MHDETARLVSASHALRDTLAQAGAESARGELTGDEPPAMLDRLSALPGRAAFETELARATAAAAESGQAPAVLVFDADRFGELNDTHGFRLADRVLNGLAGVLAELMPPPAFLSRQAGQRFAVLLPSADAAASAAAAERIRQTIEKTSFAAEGRMIRLTLSAAVTRACTGESPEAALQRCEAALTETKRSGRNRTYTFENDAPFPVAPASLSLDERTVDI
jgi:diguanylate cyclase (GGDEF)-like protein